MNLRGKNNLKINNNSGFTLIEVAIALIILGLIITPLLIVYNAEFRQRQETELAGTFTLIKENIVKYQEANGFYPRPASLLDAEGVATYGVSIPPSTAPGSCPDMTTSGYCVTAGPGGNILIGAVPFNDIKIPPDKAYDSWGHKIFYVVTEVQTDSTTYDRENNGQIQTYALHGYTDAIILLNDAGGLDPYNNHDILMFSAGPNAHGAYNANGVLVEDCIDPSNPQSEDENCDFDADFLIDRNKRRDFRTEAAGGTYRNLAVGIDSDTYANGTRNLNDGPEFYDDYTFELTNIQVALDWNYNLVNDGYAVTEANRLAIGHTAPDAAVHVLGDTLIDSKPDPADLLGPPLTTGRLITPTVCDQNGNDCVPPTLVNGNDANLHCSGKMASGEFLPVVGIGNSRTHCAAPASSSGTSLYPQQGIDSAGNTVTVDNTLRIPATVITNGLCPSGQLFLGTDNSGVRLCGTP